MTSAKRDEQIFTTWLNDHGGILRQLSRVHAPEPADADELHQEMLVQLWRSVPRFLGEAKASTWIYRVCLNTGLTWRRTTRRRAARVVADIESVETASSEEQDPADQQERGDLMDALMQAVRSLSPGRRSLVVLALDGLSYREISEITGMTENHVGVALSQALTEKMEQISHEF